MTVSSIFAVSKLTTLFSAKPENGAHRSHVTSLNLYSFLLNSENGHQKSKSKRYRHAFINITEIIFEMFININQKTSSPKLIASRVITCGSRYTLSSRTLSFFGGKPGGRHASCHIGPFEMARRRQ